jgi:hypothetical protein
MNIHIRVEGAGGHYSYLLGIASILQEYFDLDNVIYSAYSAGCIPAMLLCLQYNIAEEFEKLNIPMLCELQSSSLKCFFNFIPTLKRYLLNRLNSNPEIYQKANHRLHCNLTHAPSLENHLYYNFKSNEDLIDCCMASGHIPIYNKSLFYTFRDKYYIDGGFNKNHLNLVNYRTLTIATNSWRNLDGNFLFISSCENYAKQLYELGRLDALNHIDYYKKFLKLKKTQN